MEIEGDFARDDYLESKKSSESVTQSSTSGPITKIRQLFQLDTKLSDEFMKCFDEAIKDCIKDGISADNRIHFVVGNLEQELARPLQTKEYNYIIEQLETR